MNDNTKSLQRHENLDTRFKVIAHIKICLFANLIGYFVKNNQNSDLKIGFGFLTNINRILPKCACFF